MRTVCEWQDNGGAANFELLVAAVTPRAAIIFQADGWPDADNCCEPDLARQAVLAAIEGRALPVNTGVIAAGLSLLLGRKGQSRQRRDAVEIRGAGSVPLLVALMAPGRGDEVKAMVTIVAVEPRVLH